MDQQAQGTSVTIAAMKEVVAEMHAAGPGEKAHRFNDALIAEYRASGGTSIGELPIESTLIVTMKGARSGLERSIPLGVEVIDGRLLIIGSSAGMPRHPQWYHNIVANPVVTVEWKGETFRAEAIVITGAERDGLFGRLNKIFHDHQARTTRVIPVVELRRIDDA